MKLFVSLFPRDFKMSSKSVQILFTVMIIYLGAHGDAACAEKRTEFENTIVLSTIAPESLSYFSELSEIYSEAFRRLGYRFRLVSLPGERSLIDANSGVVDGEAFRISYLDPHKYPNLIQVSEPIRVVKDGAYSVDKSIKINGWDSLKGKGYKVGFDRSVKSVEIKLPLYVKKENIIPLNGFEQCLKMLQARRIDIYIAATLIEESAPMKSAKYSDIVRVGIVEEKAGYPWLHKRHKKLVSPLADTLKAMKADGTFQKISEAAKQE